MVGSPCARNQPLPWNRDRHVLQRARATAHASYGEYQITVGIEDGIVSGEFPGRALRHVLEWYALHQDELREDWRLAEERRALRPIAPLE